MRPAFDPQTFKFPAELPDVFGFLAGGFPPTAATRMRPAFAQVFTPADPDVFGFWPGVHPSNPDVSGFDARFHPAEPGRFFQLRRGAVTGSE